MEIFFTKEKQWLDKWDEFVGSNKNGSHLLLSDWLRSYESYGFDFEVVLCVENGIIVGGYGAVIAKMTFFKFYIVPFGPIVLSGSKLVLQQLIASIYFRSKKHKVCYSQVTLPSFTATTLKEYNFKEGSYFKYVFSFVGLNWLDLKKYNSTEEILLDFKSSVRRDIRNAERKGITISYATEPEEIKKAYNVCLENARKANYALRDWEDFKRTIVALIESGNAKFIIGTKNNEIKGAIFIIKAGGYYSYILGGTKKEKPDLLVGHLLQWEAIQLSFLEDCKGYNLSLGGSKGVQEFKNGFNTAQIINAHSKYYVINNNFLFSIFVFLEKYMKPYKNKIARILASLKKFKK